MSVHLDNHRKDKNVVSGTCISGAADVQKDIWHSWEEETVEWEMGGKPVEGAMDGADPRGS